MDYSTSITICDLTQSYSSKGGGVRTILQEKRRFLLENTLVNHCLIIPGNADRIRRDGRATTIEIKSPQVPGSPNYRLLLRSHAVLRALSLVQPDIIECQDAYNLPWTALMHRSRSKAAVVAGYHTDFPRVYVEKYLAPRLGKTAANFMKRTSYQYAANLYRRCDAFYTLNQAASDRFSKMGLQNITRLDLGADAALFSSIPRSEILRERLGVTDENPVLIYAGRIDKEKRARVVVDAFKKLPSRWGACLIMLGDGKEREALMKECEGLNAHFPGYISNRRTLAQYLASSDVYVSAMEDETFGISVIEAQAAGLPVVGVRAGAMIDRVPPLLGRLGPPGNVNAMASNIAAVWMNRNSFPKTRVQRHAESNFCWSRTFNQLCKEIYPKALAARGMAETISMQPFEASPLSKVTSA